MKPVTREDIKRLYVPPSSSHKGQNGRLLLIGGSHLFHAASLWSLTVASRIVDLVHYASVPENNELVAKAKEEFRNGIVIAREHLEEYIKEDDSVLIGPGMTRTKMQNAKSEMQNCEDVLSIADEGEQTYYLTNYLLKKFSQKQWIIDAGALQMMDVDHIPKNAILTPHRQEFEGLWEKCKMQNAKCKESSEASIEEKVRLLAKEFECIVLLKGQEDIVCDGRTGEVYSIQGGNAGMTKGGTGDVLAGLIAALACKSDPVVATIAGSYINKKAGEELSQTMGTFFNATDLANQIPKTMKQLLSD